MVGPVSACARKSPLPSRAHWDDAPTPAWRPTEVDGVMPYQLFTCPLHKPAHTFTPSDVVPWTAAWLETLEPGRRSEAEIAIAEVEREGYLRMELSPHCLATLQQCTEMGIQMAILTRNSDEVAPEVLPVPCQERSDFPLSPNASSIVS